MFSTTPNVRDTVFAVCAVYAFVVVAIIVIVYVANRLKRRQSTRTVTTTTTPASAQVYAGQQPQAQSVNFISLAHLNVTYSSTYFNSDEFGPPTSYETVIGYRNDSETVDFGERNYYSTNRLLEDDMLDGN